MQSTTGQSTNTSVFGYRKLNTTALKIGNVPKWLPDNEKQFKYSPSAYMYEMGLSSEERTALQMRELAVPRILEFLDMGQTSYQRDSIVDVNRPLFDALPSEIIFQQFEPPTSYDVLLSLRNIDKVARSIKLVQEESPYFTIIPPKLGGSKVAPGMVAAYTIRFTPDQRKDYHHQLVCITEREKFLIPVRALGPRAVLDFPDELHFPTAPVKYASTKTVLVRNVGNHEGKFDMEITSPFTVEPMEGSLGVGEYMQLNVEFKPKKVGDYKGSLTVHYNTGEDICIKLYGGSCDANVRMDKSSVKLDNTFIGMTSQRSVIIHNRSDVVVHYEWKAYATEEEEQIEKEIRMKTLNAEESLAKEAFTKECFRDPTVRDRMSMLTRAFGSRRRHYVDEEKFIYYDEIIAIEPPEGEIWPNSQAEISIVFTPDEPTSYTRTVYCDVTGRETRLPLRIKGEGLGPKLQFSFDSLNIENVFVNSPHAYEVILENKGGIEAMYNITPSNNSLFGPNFSFSPNEGVLHPGGLQAIQISFCSSVLGEFDEVFLLSADGAPEPVKLRISGKVIGPKFQFDVSEIKFGLVSCGFVNTAEVTLCNTSEIPMTYHLRVPRDGSKESLQEDNRKTITAPPVSSVREFTIRPRSGTIPPDLSQDIQVDFTPVNIKNYSVVLVVDVEGVGEEVFSLPIMAKSVVPQISLTSATLDYGRCFIGCPCTRYVELVNSTTLPARYEMQSQAENEFVVYSSTSPKGVILPNSILKVPIQIEVRRLGEMMCTVTFIILGGSDTLEVELHYIGEGPVVNVSPTHINWSRCPVLTPVKKIVTLSNQAVINAEFECVMTRDRTVFSVEPVSGVVPAEGTLELTVTAELDDSIQFTDKLTVVVFHGVSHTLNLIAEGHGTTIVSQPSLQPLVDLGPHFSSRPCSKQFTLTNNGRRKQVLYWVTEGFSIVKMRRAEMAHEKADMLDIGRMHTQRASSNTTPKRPVFQVVPDKLDLEPRESKTITIEGHSINPQVAKEKLLCYSIIGRNPQKEHIMSVDITANFISPVLKFSKEELHFSTVLPPGSKLQVLKQHFSTLNVLPLPVTSMFTSNYPFLFASEVGAVPRLEVKLNVGEEAKLELLFDPAYRPDRHSRTHNSSIEVTYKEHHHKDYIPLKSEVHFPNVVFEQVEVDFGCILNDTEHNRYVKMTNTSPLPVHYQWYFIEQPPVVRSDPANDDEGIDVNSTCEMEDETESSEETKPAEEEIEVRVSSNTHSQVASASNKSSPQQSPDKPDVTAEQSKEPLRQPSIYLDSSQHQKIIFDASKTMPVGQEDVCPMDEPVEQQAQSLYSEDAATPEEEEKDDVSSDSNDGKPQPWELVGDRFAPIRIEQIFDILPLHGILPCGQSQEVQFTFYGHADIMCSVMAACKVEGGPTYRVNLSGEASRVEYKFDRTTVDVGPHLYDKVIKEMVTLTNIGKVEFKFFTIDVPDSGDLTAGGITVSPASGVLSSLEKQVFTIQYLPGTPEPFSKSLLLQVAHFKPDTITVVGTGVFPSMSLNLPRLYPEDGMDMRLVEQSIVKQFAIENSDTITSAKPVGRTTTKPRPELPPFILDFGYVVHGCVEYRSVTLTNISYPLISFTTAHGSLHNTGFSVDIGERIKNLPGAPDCESIEFKVKFDPASVHCPLGKVEARLPFNLVGGPVYWLNLMATVTLPDLSISMSYINFETVQCGQCKVVTIRIRNPYNIKCEWCAVTEKAKKKPPKFTPLHVKKKLRGPEQLSCFELYPISGCLLPGDWINVKLKFMPTEEINYKQTIPIKVSQNPNSNHQLTLEGIGNEPKITFSQPLLEFGPVFPFSPGDYQEVTIHNPTSFPIEFYSVDFDTQYLEEEEILRWIKGYNKQKCILLPPREAGEKLPVDIIKAYEYDQSNMKTRSSMLGETDSATQAESSLSVTDITPSQSQLHMDKPKLKESENLSAQMLDVPQSTSLTSSTSLSPPITIMPAFESTSHLLRKLEQGEDLAELQNSPVCTTLAKYMGVDISPEAKLAESRRGVVILMYGPVMSGKTTQAQLLARVYGGTVLTIDSIIIDAISKATTAAGKRARESCIEATISPVDSIPASNAPQVTENIASKKSSQKGDKEQTKPDQTLAAEQTTTALSCESPQPFQVEQIDNNSSLNTCNNTLMPTRLPEDCVIDILSERLQQPDCQKAAIFDGLASQFVSTQQTLAGLVLKAINNRKYIFFINLSMTLEEIKQREKGIEEEKLHQERLEEERQLAEEKAKRDEEERLDQLSEDEYEALSDEVKAQIDARRLKARKERIRQRREEQQKLLQQKQAMEEARKEEEGRDKSRRNKRKSKITAVKTEAKVESIKSSRPPSASSIGKQPSLVFRTSALGGLGSNASLDRPLTPSDSPSEANLAVKPTKKKARRTSAVMMDDNMVAESSMDKKYKQYEESLVGLNGLMDNWIRALGEVKPKKETEPTSGVEDTPTHTTASKRKSRKEIAPIVVDPVPELVVPVTSTGISLTDFDDMEGVGVPVINATASAATNQVFEELYRGGVLPSVEEVLDGMGLGPDGPPIPPPYQFSVILYPQHRRSRQDNLNNHFEFVASSPDDPNAAVPEEISKPVSETELPEGQESEQIMPATSGRTSKKSSIRSTESTDTGSSKGKPKSTRSQKAISPIPSVLLEEETTRPKSVSPGLPAKLAKFRWVIPADDMITLKMKFISDEVGQIDQTFTFEIVATKRKYQLFCRGHAIFPSISREPRLVFAHRKNSIRDGEIIHKKFVLSQDKYFFGPLHCGKTRERYREGRYPDNMEKLSIINTSAIICNATFCFEHDTNATTFLLDPPGMVLQPGQTKELTVWAYPKASKHYEDSIVCCIKHNPEPAVFPICCDGVQPELEVDKKAIQFDKVLLHRKETRNLFLRNNTLLPVQWKLSGLDALGNDFSFNQDNGIVQPRSEFELKIHFRASRAMVYSKKSMKLEISDVEQIIGLMHVETIQIIAEAYDVAMDISFPRGADGGLDFQCIRVGDEAKQSIQLKNKGKYDIEYRIMFDSVDGCDLSKYFTTQSSSGILYPGDKPHSVVTVFRAEQEINIKDQPVLKCQIIEPHVGESGDVIANIPIRVSARAVYSVFSISPVNDINFGSIILNSKRTRSFLIENKGEFEFKYAITKLTQDKQRKPKDPRDVRIKSRDGQTSSQLLQKSAGAAKGKPDNNLRNDVPTVAQRLVIGMFTLHPAGGVVAVGQSQTINIDCVAETLGRTDEVVAIDISGRPMWRGRSPLPIQYKIYGEVLLPGINYIDIVSIFEEHRICKKLGLISQHHFKEDGSVGVYGEEDKRFVFHSVIVGQSARAQFKIANPNKIPCDAHIAVKPMVGKGSSKGMAEGFDVEPTKVSIPAHSHVYATVTFRPTAMQVYNGQFEASVDGPPVAKNKVLTFDVQGEGSLPQITVMRPTMRNHKGLPLLLYRRLLLGQSQILPLVLRNNGNITATVILDVINGAKSFGVVPSDQEASAITPSLPAKSPLIMDIKVGEETNFDVIFSPSSAKKCKGTLRLSLRNNQFEDTPIQLVGEGYEEEVTIDNVRGQVGWTSEEELVQSDSNEEISAVKDNHLQFGDCAVKESRQITFTLTNHSTTNIYWFQWPTGSHLAFLPRTGHLHPGKSKDVTVTFRASQPKCLKNVKAFAKFCQIVYSKPLSEVTEWDDSMRSVKWVTIRQQSRGSEHQAGSPTSGNIPSKPASATERGIADTGSAIGVVKPPVTPAKRKIEEVDPEPSHSIVEDSQREFELFVSAVADHAKYSTTTTSIKFRDTFMYQTRSYSFTVVNTGKVAIQYQWVMLDDSGGSVTPVGELHLNDAGSIISEGGDCPAFTFEPTMGKIAVGEEYHFVVKFSPLDVQDMHATFQCVIPNLEESANPLMVTVQGRVLMPYCHFELEQSNYLTSGRRSASQRGPFGAGAGTALETSTKVIEFHSCGVGVKDTKCFSIINPTSQAYEFFWANEDGIHSNKNPVFKCLTTKGFISGGKKSEVVFECTPNCLDLVESFWRFSIPSLSISIPFLLVSSAVEPAVSMDRAYLKFKAMLLGTECHETVYLVNDEPQVYSFSFVETSCYSDGHTARVKVQPMIGTLQPHSKLPIYVSFVATREREYNFNLQCQVKKKPTPIILNVKAEGFLITYTLHYEDCKGSMIELLTGKGLTRRIDLGKVEVQEKCLKRISLINNGKYSFEYAWELVDTRGVLTTKSPTDPPIISILPLEGNAEPNQRTMSELTFCPPAKLNLKGTELVLKIKNGSTLPISLVGCGVEPVVQLSFSEHDFGPCFLHRAYMPPKQVTLSITNKDKKDISLNCLYVNKPHLEVHTDAGVKPPNKVTEATISFLPRDTIKYCETIWFEVNGLSRVPVIIKGEGTQMKVEVANPAQKVVNFGAVSIGSKTTKLVKVINRSLTSITFTVSVALSSAVLALQQEGMLSIAPTSEITLKANGGTHTIEVTFKPTVRVPSFSEEVMLECSGLSQPLFVVIGSCHGIEITLDTYHIPFGAVVLQSQSSRRILLLNTGDIGAKFTWDVKKFAPDFAIAPVEGYISPGMQIPFDITFCPKQTNRDIRYEKVPCEIEGSKPLLITLTGTCIEQVPLKEVLHFTTMVRNQESRQITLHNRTTTPWLVRPIIDGEYWSGANTISIDPGHPKHYELIYAPLRMTTDTTKHHGSIFFPFPDGNGLLYNLLGTAEPPKQAGSIYQEIPCKTSHTELLRVTNWLRRPQRFRAIVEMIKPDKQDRSITLNGLDYIDVPALGKKDYKLNFYSYKEGSFSAKVTFRNEQTLEYLFYNVHFKATPPGTMATINLTTTVRKNVSHTITIFNPLPSPVTMNTNVTSQDINLPASFIVGAESEGTCMFEYLPLKVGEATAKLVMTSNELGLYQYELRLVANPAPPERTIHFTTTIGNSLQQLCKFVSFAKARTEYICKVDNVDFHVERNLTVASAGSSGTEATVEVTFEPSHLGDTKGNLTITSQVGGDYTIPLIGHCLVPKPQGPYTIKAGLNITIPFKNVFSQPTHFTFTVDNPVFSVKATELLKPKKVCNLLVSYDKQADPQLTKTGKLVVTCPPGTPGASAGLQWIYYLKGIVPQN